MKTIISVRVAIVVRGEYYDKNPVSPATLTIFNGLVDGNGTALTKVVALPDPHYRYRVFEFTVPLRDMLVLAAG
jgi:type IV pilus assembly protein PilW